jgi:hypothetical protein
MNVLSFERAAMGVLVLLGAWGAAQGDWADVTPLLLVAVLVAGAAAAGIPEGAALLLMALVLAGRGVVVETSGTIVEPTGVVLGVTVFVSAARGRFHWSRLPSWGKIFVATCIGITAASAAGFAMLQTHYALSTFMLRSTLLNALTLAGAYALYTACKSGDPSLPRAYFGRRCLSWDLFHQLHRNYFRRARYTLCAWVERRRLLSPLSVAANASAERVPAYCFAFLIILSLPWTQKLQLPVAQVAPQDIAVALVCLAFLPQIVQALRRYSDAASLKYPLLFVAVAGLSAAATAVTREAAIDMTQLVLYCLFAAWIFTRLQRRPAWRAALPPALIGALLLSAALAGWAIAVPDATASFPAAVYTLAGAAFLYAASLSKARRSTRAAIAGVCATASVVAALLVLAQPVRDSQEEQIPQRYREAYAALSVTAEHPLFGLGIGKYQQDIGAFYQGMPKENALRPGTRVGHTVLLASTGLLGLGAYLAWLAYLWMRATDPCLKGAVLVVLLGGFLTSMLTSPALLLTALTHGIITGGGFTRE